jgi:4-amino-4-deoxy-L-arabinose transferase-like glycosyltransferase
MTADTHKLSLRSYILLAILALAFFLPGIAALPPIDRDEPRYTQATTQMLESGDFVDIRFMDQVRYKQPAGIYWIQSARGHLARSQDLGPPSAVGPEWHDCGVARGLAGRGLLWPQGRTGRRGDAGLLFQPDL